MSFANFERDIEANPTAPKKLESSTPRLIIISNELSDFINLISKLTKIEDQLGTKRDNKELREDATEIIKKSNKLHIELSDSLFQLDNIVDPNPTINFTKNKLRTQFQDVFKNYQVVLRNYNEKIASVSIQEEYQKNQESATEHTPLLQKSDSGDAGRPQLHPQTQPLQYQSQIQIQKQKQQTPQITNTTLEYHSDLINQREEAITNISQGVQDINKIFKDLNEIVNQQGEQIDTIEDNMITYANSNQLASHELVKADNYQKKKRKCSCIILLALVILLVIILLVIS